MKITDRLKNFFIGVILIVAGIATLIWNFFYAELVSLGYVPLAGGLMIVIGFYYIRRAVGLRRRRINED